MCIWDFELRNTSNPLSLLLAKLLLNSHKAISHENLLKAAGLLLGYCNTGKGKKGPARLVAEPANAFCHVPFFSQGERCTNTEGAASAFRQLEAKVNLHLDPHLTMTKAKFLKVYCRLQTLHAYLYPLSQQTSASTDDNTQ